jgi:hypothetical protein
MTHNGEVQACPSHSGVTARKRTQGGYTVDTSTVSCWHELGRLLYTSKLLGMRQSNISSICVLLLAVVHMQI